MCDCVCVSVSVSACVIVLLCDCACDIYGCVAFANTGSTALCQGTLNIVHT